MKTILHQLLSVLLLTSVLCADGLMRPGDKAYPGNFLRHRMSKVEVVITGQIARTTVYQEFVNEWTSSTDVVYSFPLPPDARATALYFWANDTMYRAVLKVKEQAVNPGTGEGGIDAEVNAYLGPNALRMIIPGVPAGSVQRVQLEYLSLCPYGNGTTEYRYPADTRDFVLYPVETFIMNIDVRSERAVTASSFQPLPGSIKQPEPARLQVSHERSKTYLTSDLFFSYSTAQDSFATAFYAADNDTMDGHFVMTMTSPSGSAGADVFRKNVVFIFDRSSDMFGANIADARVAVGECIKRLGPNDAFNVISLASTVTLWRGALSPATNGAKDSAVGFLSSLVYSSGSVLLQSLQTALNQFPSDTTHNIIVLFSDGKSTVNPQQVRTANTKKAAVMTIAGASTAGKQRLEMIAYLNYGIPSFIAAHESMKERVVQIFDRINLPVMKDVQYETGTNVHSILPVTAASLYKGSLTYFTGRFKQPGAAVFSVAGHSPAGPVIRDIPLVFPADKVSNTFTEKFWAKEKIDDLERRIAVYGESDSLKKAVIALSLGYDIRCKYTSYNAEKTYPVLPPPSSVDEIEFLTLLGSVTPEGTLLEWSIPSAADVKEFRIYRRMSGSADYRLAATVSGNRTSWLDAGSFLPEASYRIDAVTASGRVHSSRSFRPGTIPLTAALHANYPNPFNPSTTIVYENPRQQHVLLTVYDVTGREIVRLTDGIREAGSHAVSFSSKGLSSGIYFYTLRAGDFSRTRSMVLTK